MLDERICWYNVSLTEGLGPAAAQKIARRLSDLRQPVTVLVALAASQLHSEFGLSGGVAHALEQRLLDPIELPQPSRDSELLVPGDEHFPNARFLDANPPLSPVLWAGAERSLLSFNGPTLGIAGSRETTERVLELVYDLAKQASKQGWMVISGLAAGVDSSAHQGALIGGTGTIGVLASGIANTTKSWAPDDMESICLVSQFMPSEPWSGPRAMQRNLTIAALSDRVVVAAAGASGGSWEMAQLCLKRRKQLFVFDLDQSEAEGNRKLIKAGASPLDFSDLTGCLGPLEGPLTLFT